ncbi:MAG: hypothetical protein ACOH2L_18340 [Devosia sp.]
MKILTLVALLPTMLGGCAAASSLPAVLPHALPTNANLGLQRSSGANVIGTYTARAVTDPKPWREVNDLQGPNAGGNS